MPFVNPWPIDLIYVGIVKNILSVNPMTDSTSNPGTITNLLQQLQSNDERVVQEVFQFYFYNLAQRAKKLLREMGGVRLSDEEDLAMLVMTAFLKDAAAGELSDLRSRHDVWRMLSKRIRLRAINMVRDEKRKKSLEVGESVFENNHEGQEQRGIQQQPGRNIEDLSSYHNELIETLEDPLERELVSHLLEGKEIAEIAYILGKSPATVYRKLKCIKESWDKATHLAISP